MTHGKHRAKAKVEMAELFSMDRDCEPVDPGRFERGVHAGLTGLQVAHSASGPMPPDDLFGPIVIESYGTVTLNETMPENRMMGEFLKGYGPFKDLSEKSSAISRMVGFYLLVGDVVAKKLEVPGDLFQFDAAGDIEAVSNDLFRAAALAPIKMAGRFNPEEVFRLARPDLGREQAPS